MSAPTPLPIHSRASRHGSSEGTRHQGTHARLLAGVALAAVLGLLLGCPAAAHAAGGPTTTPTSPSAAASVSPNPQPLLRESPTSGPPGTVVHLSASDCNLRGGLTYRSEFVQDEVTLTHQVTYPSRQQGRGSFTATFTVPPAAVVGPSVLSLDCDGVVAIDEPFTVTAAGTAPADAPVPHPAVQVSPASGPAGTVVHVAGQECNNRGNDDFHDGTLDQILPIQHVKAYQSLATGSGWFNGSFPVPAGAAVGAATIVFTCNEVAQFTEQFTVTAPGAQVAAVPVGGVDTGGGSTSGAVEGPRVAALVGGAAAAGGGALVLSAVAARRRRLSAHRTRASR